jgi:hypothetical protein
MPRIIFVVVRVRGRCFIVLFAIAKNDNVDTKNVPENVLLTFTFEFVINVLVTSPIAIAYSRVFLPALAVWLLAKYLEPDDAEMQRLDDQDDTTRAAKERMRLVHATALSRILARRWRCYARASAQTRPPASIVPPDPESWSAPNPESSSSRWLTAAPLIQVQVLFDEETAGGFNSQVREHAAIPPPDRDDTVDSTCAQVSSGLCLCNPSVEEEGNGEYVLAL